jgi:hypothetical protein
MKPGSKLTTVTLTTKPDSADSLLAALTAILSVPKSEIRFLALTSILPTFTTLDRAESIRIHKGMMEITTQLHHQFAVKKTPGTLSGPFVDVFTCLYRMRYRNSINQAIEKTIADIGVEIRRHLIVIWCEGIIRCAEAATSDTQVFFSRLVAYAANTVARTAESLSVVYEYLFSAVEGIGDPATRPKVQAAPGRIAKMVQAATDIETSQTPPCDMGHLRWLKNIVLIMMAGIIVGMFQADTDELAGKVITFTKSTIEQNSVEQAKYELQQKVGVFLTDMLGMLDGRRYEQPFQFVFCLSGLPTPQLGPFLMD